jgi:hypothetical protein
MLKFHGKFREALFGQYLVDVIPEIAMLRQQQRFDLVISVKGVDGDVPENLPGVEGGFEMFFATSLADM